MPTKGRIRNNRGELKRRAKNERVAGRERGGSEEGAGGEKGEVLADGDSGVCGGSYS